MAEFAVEVKWRHGRHIESMTSRQKSDSVDAYLLGE